MQQPMHKPTPTHRTIPTRQRTDRPTDAGGPASVVLATTTNFVSTEMVSVDSRTGQVLSRSTFADGDAVVLAKGSKGFVLERTRDVLNTLQSNGAIAASIPLQSLDAGSDAGSPGLNPRDVVVVDNRAYVPLFNQSAIVVVDLQSNTVTSTIDLSSLVDTKDNDGSIDLSERISRQWEIVFRRRTHRHHDDQAVQQLPAELPE